jgi:hypothetical protein
MRDRVDCRIAPAVLAAGAPALLVGEVARAQSALPLETSRLPAGFTIELVARVPNARAMAWGAALAGGKAVRYEPFAEGWLQGERAWDRPADVLVTSDGSLLVSDDDAGAIYRISYRGQ